MSQDWLLEQMSNDKLAHDFFAKIAKEINVNLFKESMKSYQDLKYPDYVDYGFFGLEMLFAYSVEAAIKFATLIIENYSFVDWAIISGAVYHTRYDLIGELMKSHPKELNILLTHWAFDFTENHIFEEKTNVELWEIVLSEQPMTIPLQFSQIPELNMLMLSYLNFKCEFFQHFGFLV
jgi:hypothetical protein